MKKIIILWILCILSSISTIAAPINMAVVNVFEVLDKAKIVKFIRDQIDNIRNNAQKEFSEKEVDLKKEEERLLAQKGIIAEDLFEKERKKFHKKVSQVQREADDKKRKIDHAYATAMEEVDKVTVKIIKSIAQEKKVSLVLPSSQLLYADDKLDITDQVLKKLDENLKTLDLKL
jgi:outer membrane protein